MKLQAMAEPLDGSSPRMRGTLVGSALETCRLRFIPAHAGNARGRLDMPNPQTVHPRACGERGLERHYEILAGGSSPRMRGTPP